MTPSDLERAGEALFGQGWQTYQMADLLSVTTRSVRRWLSGSEPVPSGIGPDLWTLLADRRDQLNHLLAEMT